ncbi:MAG: hypothetical protein CMI04_00515 [Oceanospirillaceae bacterium]|nr:hypothetical protein [Oceanospirillaceae bacterium]
MKQHKRVFLYALISVFTLGLMGCQPDSGVDGLIHGGYIYSATDTTNATDTKDIQAVAFDEGKIVYVGNLTGAEALVGESTQIIDLKGGMLMPGLIDAHVHPLLYALFSSYPSLQPASNVDELIALMKTYEKDTPSSNWVIGFGFPIGMFSDDMPTKEILDEHFPNRPVALISHHMHVWWLNSAALEDANITAETADPQGGFIHRVPGSQEPSGILEDQANFNLIMNNSRLLPSYQTMYRQFQAIFSEMAAQGYVAYMDAGVSRNDIALAYYLMNKFGLIKLKGNLAMIVMPDQGVERVREIATVRQWLETDSLRYDVAKFWIDGMIDNRHAYMKAPYENTTNRGQAYFNTEIIKEYIRAAEAEDLNTHLHVIGDAALGESVDAFSELSETMSFSKRHYFTHLQVADSSDIKRIADLNLGINISPSWARRDLPSSNGKPVDLNDIEHAIGPRLHNHRLYLPFKTMYDSGARITAGSDYPFTTLNPFEAIEVGMTRQYYGNGSTGPIPDAIQPDQRVSLEHLLRSNTIEAAYQLGREDELGSIEVGKSASFTLVDRNLFATQPADIGKTVVTMTIIDGETVYEK